jgi:glycosyltransferase involved in cell wall biosynthesis
MRIVFALPSLRQGGSERVVRLIADALSGMGADVTMLVLDARGRLDDPALVNPVIWVEHRFRSALFGLPSLVREIRRRRPHVVFTTFDWFNPLACALRPLFGRRTGLVCRQSSPPSIHLHDFRFPAAHRWATRHLLPQADRVVCQTSSMRDDLLRHFGTPPGRLTVIGNPVDVRQIPTSIERPPIRGRRMNLVAVGNFSPQKRFHLLIPILLAAEGLDYHLTLVGDGPERADVERGIRSAGLGAKVTFAGRRPSSYPYLMQADALLVTSRFEGCPNVVLEAGACGVPTIAFAVPGVDRELIDDGVTGALVPEGDVTAFSRAIRSLATAAPYDSERIRQRVCGLHSLAACAARYAALFVEVCHINGFRSTI